MLNTKIVIPKLLVLQTTSLGSFNEIYDDDKLSIDDDDDDDINKIGNVYSLEYTEILKVFLCRIA